MIKLIKALAYCVILSSSVLIGENVGGAGLEPLPGFDWEEVMNQCPKVLVDGNQVLHFGGKNKPYENNEKARAFVEEHCRRAKRLRSDSEVLRFASDAVRVKGMYLEMGVATGKTINFIAALNPMKKIYGFDSFEGLPRKWERYDVDLPAGMFGFKDKENPRIAVLNNVVLYKGLFKEVLPRFRQDVLKEKAIAFLHIDCDIYESTREVFDALGDNIVEGTVIVFDEFYNYSNSEEHEYKAFREFLARKKLRYDVIAFNVLHEQVAVRIRK